MKSTEKLLHSNQLSPTLRHRCRLQSQQPYSDSLSRQPSLSCSQSSVMIHGNNETVAICCPDSQSLSLSFRVSSFGIRLSILLVLRENGSAVYEMKIVRTICARQQSLKVSVFSGVGERICGSSARQNQRSQLINHRQFLSFLQINFLRIVSSLVVSLPKMNSTFLALTLERVRIHKLEDGSQLF